MTATVGLVLAGGLSRRMGENKLLLPLGGERLIDRVIARLSRQCSCVLVNSNDPLPELDPALIVPDDLSGHQGPLAGLVSGMAAVRARFPLSTHILTAAGDTPFFPTDLAHRLLEGIDAPDTIAVASDLSGRWHPTFALWPLQLETDLRVFLARPENRRVRSFVEGHPHRAVAFPLIESGGQSIEPFFNINTPEDYRQAMAFLDGQA